MIYHIVIGVILIIIAVSLSIFLIVKHCKKKSEKMKGSGLIIEHDKTIFKFGEEIYPMISHEIFDNEFIKECWNVYEEFIEKKEEYREDGVGEILDIMACSHVVYNEFINYFEPNQKEYIEKLKEYYLTIILGDDKEFYIEYAKILDPVTTNKDSEHTISKYCPRILNIVNKYNSKFASPDDIKKLIEENPRKNWKAIVELFKLIDIDEDELKMRAIENVGTSIISNPAEYFNLFNYSRDRYIETAKYMFGKSVRLVKSGKIIQSVNRENTLVKAEKGKSTMFSPKENKDLREWIKTCEKDDIFNKFSFIMKNGNNHADVVSAAVSAVITQILIILYVKYYGIHKKSPEDYDKYDFTELFEFLKITRLNAIFINILSNTCEEEKFNIALSNSYIIE